MVGPNAVVAAAVVAMEGVTMGVATVEVVAAALEMPTVLQGAEERASLPPLLVLLQPLLLLLLFLLLLLVLLSPLLLLAVLSLLSLLLLVLVVTQSECR